MKNKVSLIVIFFLFGFCSSLPSQTTIRYFRKFNIDSRYCQIKFNYPIDSLLYTKVSCYKETWNEKSGIRSVVFLENGKLSVDKTGCSQLIIEYSDSIEKRSYMDKYDKPTLNIDGISSYVLFLNKRGHPTKSTNFDISGKITKDRKGIATQLFTLDNEDRIVKVNFLNEFSDSTTDINGCFYKSYQWREDKTSYIFVQSNFDQSDHLIEDRKGVAVTQSKYDKTNHELIEQRYFGEDRKLKESKHGFSIIHLKYNSHGKVIEQRLYGNDEKLIGLKNKGYIKNGFAIVKYKYDNSDNNLSVQYFGNDEKLKQNNFGIAEIIYKYDNKNRKITESLYDVNNHLISSNNGCTTNWVYDISDNIIEESHFGTDNELKENKHGIAIIRWDYDSNGNIIKTRYFDSNKKIVSEN